MRPDFVKFLVSGGETGANGVHVQEHAELEESAYDIATVKVKGK